MTTGPSQHAQKPQFVLVMIQLKICDKISEKMIKSYTSIEAEKCSTVPKANVLWHC